MVKIPLKDIRSQVEFFSISGFEIIVLTHQNKFRVFRGQCPHLGGPLLEAKRDKHVLECPWHRYKVDLLENKIYTSAHCPWRTPVKQTKLKLREYEYSIEEDFLVVRVDEDGIPFSN